MFILKLVGNDSKTSTKPPVQPIKTTEAKSRLNYIKSLAANISEELNELKARKEKLSVPEKENSSLQSDNSAQNEKNIQQSLGNTLIKHILGERLTEKIFLLGAQLADKLGELGQNTSIQDSTTDEATKKPTELDNAELPEEPQDLGDGINNRIAPNQLPQNHPDVKEVQEQVLDQNLREAGAQGLGNKNTHISQFAGNSNINGLSKDFGINGDCGVCAGVSAARILGAMHGDAHSANADIEKFRGLAKPGSNHFEGTQFDDLQRGAEGLGLQGEQLKGDSNTVLAELKKGNVPIVSVNSKEYGVLKKKKEKVGHAVTVEGFDEKTNSFIVNDSLLDKQISVPKDVFERAMKSAKFAQGSILSLSKKGGDQLVQNDRRNALPENKKEEKAIPAENRQNVQSPQTLQSAKPSPSEKLPTSASDFSDPNSPFYQKGDNYEYTDSTFKKKPTIDLDSLSQSKPKLDKTKSSQ